MGDRHGGRFARRGRALNPPRPQVDAHRGVGFRCNGAVGRIYPRARTLPSAKASRHGARAKGFAPRRNAPHGEGLSTRRTSERICHAQKRSPRRRPPDTAHGRKDLPRAGTLPTAKASRHGARAKGFARAGTRPSAKASRHGARAKGFAQRGSHSLRVPTNGGPPSTDERPEKHTFGGVAPETARPLPSSFTEKK